MPQEFDPARERRALDMDVKDGEEDVDLPGRALHVARLPHLFYIHDRAISRREDHVLPRLVRRPLGVPEKNQALDEKRREQDEDGQEPAPTELPVEKRGYAEGHGRAEEELEAFDPEGDPHGAEGT